MGNRFMGWSRRYGGMFVCLLILALSTASSALAQPAPPPDATRDQCTNLSAKLAALDDAPRGAPDGAIAATDGKVTEIIRFVTDTVGAASRSMYQGIISNNSYSAALNAATALMVVIYGVGFTVGVIQATFSQALLRLFKIGLIYTLVSPNGGWAFFNLYVVTFFNGGADELIRGVMSIGTNITLSTGSSTFYVLDRIADLMLSPDMVIAILGSFTNGGPFGLTYGLLMTYAMFGVIKLIIEALRIYAVSFVIRSLLLGLAPIFLVFMLFDKTKQLFTSWVNALVNQSLLPVLYFTFISFFLVLIINAQQSMLGDVELCFSETTSATGVTNKFSKWVFKTDGAKAPELTSYGWEGPTSCLTGKGECKPFPIEMLGLLSFLILVFVANEFSRVVDNIARDISNSMVGVGTGAKSEIMAMINSGGGGRGGGARNQGGA